MAVSNTIVCSEMLWNPWIQPFWTDVIHRLAVSVRIFSSSRLVATFASKLQLSRHGPFRGDKTVKRFNVDHQDFDVGGAVCPTNCTSVPSNVAGWANCYIEKQSNPHSCVSSENVAVSAKGLTGENTLCRIDIGCGRSSRSRPLSMT
jgi:hypothetical protein